MSQTSSRLLELLSLLQGRREWPGAELADRLEVSGRTVRRDVERLRDLGYPVESRDRARRRIPASRRNRDAAAAPRRRRGDRDRRRPTHRGARLGDGHRGERRARAGQARAGPAGPPAPARPRAGLGDDHAPGRRPDGRPAGPDGDRRRVPGLRAPSVRLPPPRRHREPARGRAPHARQPRAPLVSRRLGPPPRGLADLPRRPAGPPGRDRCALQPAHAAGAGCGCLHRAEHHRGARTASRPG